MAAALPQKVRAARYVVAEDAGLVDVVQSESVAQTKSHVKERSFIKGQYRTSRIARKKDSILPAECPRTGAVWSKTEPIALHDGYAS